jgi:hypothetical protein
MSITEGLFWGGLFFAELSVENSKCSLKELKNIVKSCINILGAKKVIQLAIDSE